ncbi:related to mitochondrial translocase protein [Phialocephala subalpina]|uniref:Mitochondrial import inner membrane translocase subunit TIM50 n=1 Tax=Phialocephala subalpina TaxID=576137 RepID=A0A1L7WRI8_9HELO|nr:related to mitochondrial translocase protein [Phialocephala subalpina]
MLSRAAIRSLQAPALRPTPAALRIASSTVWSRSMARHNKPNRKPTDYSRPPGAPAPSRPGGASAAFTQPNQGARSSDRSGTPDYSNKQDEFSKGASPERNTTPQSEGRGAGSVNSQPRKWEDPAFSGKQDEFGAASPSENTAPQSSSPSAIDPAEAQEQSRPLPDLTKGIPSTLEWETTGSTKAHTSPLNLTAAEEPGQSGGGRGRGELPASAYVSSSERKRLQFANYMYAMFAGLAVTGTIYLGRNWETEEEERAHAETAPSGWAIGLMWNRARARLGDQLSYYHEPAFRKLLPDPDPIFERPYTLVLSMEDLLIHSEWSREHGWRMAKRPGVDYFLRYLSQYYELVIFTSQPWGMAEPVIRKLDPYHIVTWPLFREATLYENGEYVKDLSYLNRDLSKVIIIDTKAEHVKKQPENAIILKPWEGDPKDKELVALIPFLEYIHTMAYSDVRKAIASFEGQHIPTEFAKREAVARKKFQEQIQEEQKKRPKHSGVGFLGSALGIKHQSMMMDPNEQTPAEAFAQGKMLQDQARERGQRNYELLEREIRENGEKWLKEEAALEEKAKEEATKAMKTGFTGWFGSAK